MVTGPWLEPLAVPVQEGTRYFGVRLRPGAAETVLGVKPEALRNQSVPAAPFLGGVTPKLRSALLDLDDVDAAAVAMDEIWMDEVHRLTPTDPLVDGAVERLIASRGERPIAELAKDLGTSERTLLRHFRAATGLTPKQFARIRRLVSAAWEVVDGKNSWGQIAASVGYADQPHLHHDIVDLTGLKPDDFGDRLRSTEHERVRR